MKVAIQGIKGSFHEVAAHECIHGELELIECNTFKEVCQNVDVGNVDCGVMAIENSIAGSILQNYSLINDHDFWINAEVYLRISMNLMGIKGAAISDIKYVYSHPMALRQCSEYLWKMPHVQLVDSDDTAGSAKFISDQNDPIYAAVASKNAAELYQLEILESEIETHKNNFTRFLIIQKNQCDSGYRNNKATLCLTVKHEPGSLAKVLNVIHEGHINMTKIQSVPLLGCPSEYCFYIDVEWKKSEDYIKTIKALRIITNELKILGEYERGTIPFEVNQKININAL